MKSTRYFEEQVLRKRAYLTAELCRAVLAAPLRREIQPDGRVRHWGEGDPSQKRPPAFEQDGITLPGETDKRILRVVTLEDGETLHNAFLDRGFRKDGA